VTARLRSGPIARELDEVEPVVDADRARQVSEEDDARLERPDEERLTVGVVAGELLPEAGDAGAQLLGRQVDLGDSVVEAQEARSRR
jgi:hypothetical protein